ncbi:MAG: c-type cytochrome, partial [Cyclobacteriaceae bacterium]|nr:c-type cytochrome [Cyclobacteriaceae bacterium]
ETWLPALVKGDDIFGGSVDNQMYALLTSEDQRVISPVNRLLDHPELDKELSVKAWPLLAKIGDVPSRTRVFEKAVNDGNEALLRALNSAPDVYNAVPENAQLLEKLFIHEKTSLRMEGLRLAARWKTSQYAGLLSKNMASASDINEKLQGYRTLFALGETDAVLDAARNSTNQETRTTASVVWIESDVNAAADNAVTLLTNLDDPQLATRIFSTFCRMEAGPGILLKVLEGKTLNENIASAGLTVIQTSSLNLAELEKTLRKVGNIKSVGIEMTREEKDQLIKDAIESGNSYRGRQIYRRTDLLCQTCHQTEGEGGFSGPDLSTVGTFLEPGSILESILNPSSEIKQNYETVLLTRKNGELISGLLHRKTSNSTLIRLSNSDIVEIPAEEIEKVDVSPMSLMPPGLTSRLHRDELRDLLAYLMSLGK